MMAVTRLLAVVPALLLLLAPAYATRLTAQDFLSMDYAQVDLADTNELFLSWVKAHGKTYLDDVKVFLHRWEVFNANLAFVKQHNSEGHTYRVGLNRFADLTNEEYRAFLRPHQPTPRAQPTGFKYADVRDDDLPFELDWREHGAVTPVKNQGMCGSCWAFSTTGAVEGINAIKTGTLVSLSEQELVDCNTDTDSGCEGGLYDYAFAWIAENGGIDSESDYQYMAADDPCDLTKRDYDKVVTIQGYEDVPANCETCLQRAVANQPVSVAIQANQLSFQLYVGGVFADASCGTELDHGVLVAGYGTFNGTDYWLVKNSWGDSWGESGYIKMARGAGPPTGEGMCGIAMAAAYPDKDGTPNPTMAPQPTSPPGPPPGPGPEPTPEPGPEPVQCDILRSCPAGSTCCCENEMAGFCLQWACCPVLDAVCCDDKQHCCPPEMPVCHTEQGACAPSAGLAGAPGYATSKLLKRTPAVNVLENKEWREHLMSKSRGEQKKK
ncbi:unnamed protein product [Pedinophyceae sp. YPF-701]|nr:unnamed protein product [Pedinophyceae sp. YPF-701]